MVKSVQITILSIIIILLSNIGMSQVRIMAKPGEMFDLRELGTIILLKENKVIVEFVMPVEGRHADYREIEIRKNDEILYFNGDKIQNTMVMEKLYYETNIGQEIKLGYKRDGDLGIIEFKKADPSSFPKRQMMKVTADSNDPSGKFQEVEINGKKHKAKDGKVVIDGKEMKIEDLMEEKKEKTSTNDENKIETKQ